MKKLFCFFICILTLLTMTIICVSANEIETDTSCNTIAIFIMEGTERKVGAAKMTITNIDTKQTYEVEFLGENEWKTEMPLPQGKYKIDSLKTTQGNASFSLVKTAGSQFVINPVTYTEVRIPVTEFVHVTTLKDFLFNNFLVILLMVGSSVGLLVVKSKREKGEA